MSFTVDPAALDALAGVVDGRAAALRSATSSFRGPALGVNDAFGWLGPSADVLRDYLEMATGCIDALGDLGGTLDQMAAGLRANAEGYRQADEASDTGG